MDKTEVEKNPTPLVCDHIIRRTDVLEAKHFCNAFDQLVFSINKNGLQGYELKTIEWSDDFNGRSVRCTYEWVRK